MVASTNREKERGAVGRVVTLSDRPLNARTVRDVCWTSRIETADSLWVVEHATAVDSLKEQRDAMLGGLNVLVCSFLRASVADIGPCRHFIGSTSAVGAAAGISIHCPQDRVRAARELRGRLSARTVSILSDGELLTATNRGETVVDIRDVGLIDILTQVSAGNASQISVA